MKRVVRVRDRKDAAEGIAVLELDKPEGFSFRPGQWCFLNLPDRGFSDERGLRRHLSLASGPGDDGLVFATKVSGSAFKQTLARLEPGDEVGLEEPKGAFGLPEETRTPLVFLAGGIGITPFRSLLRHVVQAGTGHRITLLYSNRTPEEAVFLDDLQELCAGRPELRFVATMTRMGDASRPWGGSTGRIGPELIRSHCPEWERALYLLSGPPPMVDAMAGSLREMEIPEERVRTEKFSGY
ncbi:MAG: FAD-dependent oxidoreductase [Deferrisomatales bacterium]|nr:FAD-dependent oxidoreductase [Deferrisomatales bacterium]